MKRTQGHRTALPCDDLRCRKSTARAFHDHRVAAAPSEAGRGHLAIEVSRSGNRKDLVRILAPCEPKLFTYYKLQFSHL